VEPVPDLPPEPEPSQLLASEVGSHAVICGGAILLSCSPACDRPHPASYLSTPSASFGNSPRTLHHPG
jgi:hypothetical protein